MLATYDCYYFCHMSTLVMCNCTVTRGERVTNGFPPRIIAKWRTAVTKLHGVTLACLPVYVAR